MPVLVGVRTPVYLAGGGVPLHPKIGGGEGGLLERTCFVVAGVWPCGNKRQYDEMRGDEDENC